MDSEKELKEAITAYLSKQEQRSKLGDMSKRKEFRLNLNINSIMADNEKLGRAILQSPLEVLPFFDDIIREMMIDQMDVPDKQKSNLQLQKFHVTFDGSLGRQSVTPRGLTADLANKFVSSTGIVTKMSTARPKLNKSVHFCEETGKITSKDYSDQYVIGTSSKEQGMANANNVLTKSSMVPIRDFDGNPLSMEFGFSNFTDFQSLLLQEPPERLPYGQLPRSVEVILENDLVDRVKPGDR